VGGDDRGDAFAPDQVLQQHHDRPSGLGVQLTGRLVSQEERRAIREGASDRDALLLAAGQLVGPVVDPVPEADELEQLAHARVALAWLRADEPQRHLDVLRGREDRHQPERLEDEADVAPPESHELRLGRLRHLQPVDRDRAAGRPVQGSHERQERRLARAGAAAHGDQPAALDSYAHVAERVNRAAGHGVLP
jgi:hypothetical protein